MLPLPGVTLLSASVWVFSDTSLAHFGEEVPLALTQVVAGTKTGGAVGIVLYDSPESLGAPEWVVMERVKKSSLESWKSEKREGAGRDKRLSGFSAPSPT